MDASSFTRDSAGVYSASIPVAQVVRMGSGNKVTFHVGFEANDSIDSDDDGSANDWKVELVQTRYTDATGATLFDSTASISVGTALSAADGVYVNRLSSSSDVKLRMAEGSGNPKATNLEVETTGTSDVTLAEFTLKAEGAAMEFDSLVASTTATGVTDTATMVQEFRLMRGSTQLDEVAATAVDGQVVTFSLDETEELAQDTAVTYKIVAKVKAIAATSGSTSAFDQGDTLTASTSPGVGQINAKSKSDGKSVTNRSGSVTTYTQTLYSEGIQIAKVGESFTHTPNDTSSASSGEFKVTVRVTNFGSNDVYIPLSDVATTSAEIGTVGIAYGITDGTTATTSATVSATLARLSGGTEETNSVKIPGGQSADFTLTVSFNPDGGYSGNRQYRVQIWAMGHTTTDSATATSWVATTPVQDFRTGFYTINN